MTEFAAAASRLAGLAGALLGWRPQEFWKATPAELAAVLGTLAGDESQSANAGDLRRLMAMFPDAGEAPPPRFARSPSPARAVEDF